MTANRRRKRRVRARAAATGESYTAALRRLRELEDMPMRTYDIQPAGLTDIGNVRQTNEDHFLANGDLFAVADGMGGDGRGAVASAVAVDTVSRAFADKPDAEGLLGAVRDANHAVYQRSVDDQEPARLGTTLAAVAVVGDGDRERLVSLNVGDSRVYLLRDGQLRLLSADHTMVADLVRAGSLTEAEAGRHPDRHILTQAIGVGDHVVPHVASVRPAAGDRVLLCSDGLFNELAAEEIAAVLLAPGAPRDAAERLVAAAKVAGGRDNITALVLELAPH